jgi:RsiW-degrading membrane proteinase PrsW (M82 family)
MWNLDRLHLDVLAVVSLSLAPGMLWLWYFYRKDVMGREGAKRAVRLFLLGMVSLGFAAVLERPFGGMPIVQVVIVAPVAEEMLKYLVVRLTVYRTGALGRPVDGIIFSVATALGFASAENVLYIVITYLAPQIALGMKDPMFGLGMVWKLYLLRALLTVPGHALWSSMWGYSLGWIKCSGKGSGFPAGGLALAAMLHMMFNYFIMTHPVGAAGMLVLIPVTWRMFYDRIDAALALKKGPPDKGA